MRLLIVHRYQAITGGVERYLEAVMPALVERGHEVALVNECLAEPGQATVDPAGRLHTWSIADGDCEAVLDAVAKWKPDVVYLHGVRSYELEEGLVERYPVLLFA